MSENNQFSEGCSRCSDYDKLKDDLDNLNEKSKNEQREALKSCEQGREVLQKKLLKIGAVAVIGGTIVGKELIDKVANYIESFNKVTDMISYNTPTITAPVSSPGVVVAQNDADDKEDDKKDDKKDKGNKPFVPPFLGPDPYDTLAYTGSVLSGESYMDPIIESFLANEMMSLSVLPDQFDMSSLIQDFALVESLNTIDYPWVNAFDLSTDFGIMGDFQQATIVPDVGATVPLIFALPLLATPRRRRNT